MSTVVSLDLIGCGACGKPNSADGAYCRHCGARLPKPKSDPPASAGTADPVIAEGLELLADGRFDEARAAARVALDAKPDSVPALRLLAESCEAVGAFHEALTAYIRILAVHPDASHEKIKVAHLREIVSGRTATARGHLRRLRARLLAAVTTAAVAALGFWVGYQPSSAPKGAGSPFTPVRQEQFRASATPKTDEGRPAASAERQQPDASNSRRATGGTPGLLPLPSGNEPLVPPVPGDLLVTPSPGPTGPEPEPAKPASNDPERPVDNSIIDIKPSHGGGSSPGLAATGNDALRADSLMRVGRDHQQMGNFEQAADAYRKALDAGADPGAANQRLAESLARLGRKGEAAAAYERAIRGYARSAAQRPTQAARFDASIEVCRQALRLLQGT